MDTHTDSSRHPHPRHVIHNIEEVPQGIVLSATGGEYELPEPRRKDFVIYRTATENTVLLYLTEEVFGTPYFYDIQSRMHNHGIKTSRIIKTSRDIIKVIYEIEAVKKSERIDVSDPERLIKDLVELAYKSRCSDIHIETCSPLANILFRIHGLRVSVRTLSYESALSISRILFNVQADSASKSISWDHNVVSDAAVDRSTENGARLQLRLSSSPIFPSGNFHVVIRVLRVDNETVPMTELGFNPTQLTMIDEMSSGASGMVLICGPTNSGKTTTLQSELGRINANQGRAIKIITVEEPVELVIPGACQISVGKSRSQNQDAVTGSTFTTYLRGTLRQDPDVVMVGEMRSKEHVDITRDLTLAGRKVYATVHAFSCIGAFLRMREMGLPWDILTAPGFISGVLYQRLVPVLCPKCSISVTEHPRSITDELRLRLAKVIPETKLSNVRVRGDGCTHCGSQDIKGTGIAGRTPVAEVMIPDRTLLKFLASDDILSAEEYWLTKMPTPFVSDNIRRPGTALQHAISKIADGSVSPVDIEASISLLDRDIGSYLPVGTERAAE